MRFRLWKILLASSYDFSFASSNWQPRFYESFNHIWLCTFAEKSLRFQSPLCSRQSYSACSGCENTFIFEFALRRLVFYTNNGSLYKLSPSSFNLYTIKICIDQLNPSIIAFISLIVSAYGAWIKSSRNTQMVRPGFYFVFAYTRLTSKCFVNTCSVLTSVCNIC